jgi:osmoprotectant transport system ATP-binding protein
MPPYWQLGSVIGIGERPFRLLSLASIRAAVESGEAKGASISADATLRDPFAELLWSGRTALPVEDRANASAA